MPVTTLNVASEVSKDAAWVYSGGSADFTNLQRPDDDDTTQMFSSDAVGDSRYTIDDLPGEAGFIDNFDVRYRSRKLAGENNSTVRSRVTTSGGTSNAGTRVISSTAYGTFIDNFAQAPGSTPWTVALVNGADIHYEKTVGGANTSTRITSLSAEVTWTEFAGGFALFVAQWIPPLIAAASHGLMKSEIATVLSSLKSRPSSDEDFARLLEAFRVRPRFA